MHKARNYCMSHPTNKLCWLYRCNDSYCVYSLSELQTRGGKRYVGQLGLHRPNLNNRFPTSSRAVKQRFHEVHHYMLLSCSLVILQLPSSLYDNGYKTTYLLNILAFFVMKNKYHNDLAHMTKSALISSAISLAIPKFE